MLPAYVSALYKMWTVSGNIDVSILSVGAQNVSSSLLAFIVGYTSWDTSWVRYIRFRYIFQSPTWFDPEWNNWIELFQMQTQLLRSGKTLVYFLKKPFSIFRLHFVSVMIFKRPLRNDYLKVNCVHCICKNDRFLNLIFGFTWALLHVNCREMIIFRRGSHFIE